MSKKRIRYQIRLHGECRNVRAPWAQIQLELKRLVWDRGVLKPAPGYRVVPQGAGEALLYAPTGDYWDIKFTQNCISPIYQMGNFATGESDFTDYALAMPLT